MVVVCHLHQLLGEGYPPGRALPLEHLARLAELLLYLAGLVKHQEEEHQEVEVGQEHLHHHQEQLQDLLLLPPALALTTMPTINTTSSMLISSSSSTRLLGQPGSKLSSSSNSSNSSSRVSHKFYFKKILDSVTCTASTASKVCVTNLLRPLLYP